MLTLSSMIVRHVDDYIDRHIFQPANMMRSGYFQLDEPDKNLAIGYIPNEIGHTIHWQNNLYCG